MTGLIADQARALRAGEVTVESLVEAALEDLGRWEPAIRSTLGDVAERARRGAERRQAELRDGRIDRGVLHGIPIAVKDLIDVAGVPTTAGSRILQDHVATTTAPVVAALEDAGAIVVAKTNTHEFAFGALTPPTRNPYDRDRMPGGSSGGSGAIVGAGIVAGALGTDTAGSIREPAALCGAVGLKPTRGRFDMTGIVPLAWSLDTVGPIAATPADALAVFRGMAPRGNDGHLGGPVDGVAGLRVGVWTESMTRFGPGVRAVQEAALAALGAAGARVTWRSLGDPDELVAATLVVLGAEALSYHRRWLDTRRDEYRDDVLAYLDLSMTFTGEDVVGARRLGAWFQARLTAALADVDVLVAPAQIVMPPRVDDDAVALDDGRRGPRDLALIRTLAPFNLSGQPAVSVPVGHEADHGFPVSLQLVGPPRTEPALLRLADAVQSAVGFVPRPPARP